MGWMQKVFNLGVGLTGVIYGEAVYTRLFVDKDRYDPIDEEVEESFYRIHGEPKHLPF